MPGTSKTWKRDILHLAISYVNYTKIVCTPYIHFSVSKNVRSARLVRKRRSYPVELQYCILSLFPSHTQTYTSTHTHTDPRKWVYDWFINIPYTHRFCTCDFFPGQCMWLKRSWRFAVFIPIATRDKVSLTGGLQVSLKAVRVVLFNFIALGLTVT